MSTNDHEVNTVETVDLEAPGIEIVARGERGYIVRDASRSGYCLKVPNVYDADVAASQATDIATHDVLVALGVPTIPEYRLRTVTITKAGEATQTVCAEMTDLTRGQDLVVSTPDVLRVARAMNPEAWFAHSRGRPVYNIAAFFDELESMIRTMTEAHGEIADHQVDTIRISSSSGLFLVASPDGMLRTVVGDYEDGVSLHGSDSRAGDPNRWEFYMPIESYLTMAIQFFPDLKAGAADLLNRLTGGTYPAELLGEVNDFRRGAIAARNRSR